MGSTRLPGKVLADVAGAPMLARVVHRLRRARRLDAVAVATSTLPADDLIAGFCVGAGLRCHRGSEADVLDRFLRAADAERAGTIVRVTADCPLVEPEIVDRVVQRLLEADGGLDYVSNTLAPRTFPRGLDVEAFTAATLARAARDAKAPDEREHVTPHIYRNPGRFRIEQIRNPQDLSGLRWTVDEPADLEFVRTVFAYFGNDSFSWRDLLEALRDHPEWSAINDSVRQKEVRA